MMKKKPLPAHRPTTAKPAAAAPAPPATSRNSATGAKTARNCPIKRTSVSGTKEPTIIKW